MFEVIEYVNGYAITRMKDWDNSYHVDIPELKEYHRFYSLNAARNFCRLYPKH